MSDRGDHEGAGPHVSAVVPCYGSPGTVEELFLRTKQTMAKLDVSFEMILVDDRCPMESWTEIERLARIHEEIIAIRLARNFGQHPAIYAGLAASRGDWVTVMDCDLQDQPEQIEIMYEHARSGRDVVRGLRSRRKDSLIRRFVSRRFYSFLSFMTGVKHSAEIANFGIYRRKVIDALLAWDEDHRYFPAAVQWLGFETSDIEVEHSERKEGKSSYNLLSLLRLALGIVVSFSDKPLRLMVQAGLIVALASFLISLTYLVMALAGLFEVEGWASIIISVWFLGGCIITAIGLVGVYVGQVMREAKGRPNYVVDRELRNEAAGTKTHERVG